MGAVIWQLDENNPFEDAFEESLLEMTSTPAIMDAALVLLLRAERDPLQGQSLVIDGKTLHVVRTPAVAEQGIPSLQLVYSVDPDQSLVQPVLLTRMTEASVLDAELRSAIAAAVYERPPQREILFPSDPTDIPEDQLEMAVRSVVERRKAHS